MKKTISIFLLLALLLTSCKPDNEPADIIYSTELEADASITEVTEITETTEATEITEATEETRPSAMYPEAYTDVLLKYQKARAEGWDRGMCVENGMSPRTVIEYEYDGLYYALSDLNADGTQELVIAEYPYRTDTDTGFIDIYTIVNTKVDHVMTDDGLLLESLCEGGFVKRIGSEHDTYNHYVSFWKLGEASFEKDLAVYEIDGQWYMEGYRGVGLTITREEADTLIGAFPPAKLDFTEIPAAEVTRDLTGYESFDYIIHKYATALTENWTWDQLRQNDISPSILGDNMVCSNLGWCLLDIDGDGIEDLVISDGVQLFDLYVIQPHNGSLKHLLSACPDYYQLCENGLIRCQEFYSGRGTWRWLYLAEQSYFQKELVTYDGQLDQYYYGGDGSDGAKVKPISKGEAMDIIYRDRTAELTLTPFVPEEVDSYEGIKFKGDTWQDVYKQILVTEPRNYLKAADVGSNMNDRWMYFGIHDFDGDATPELIIGDLVSVAVFTFSDGNAQKLADLYIPDQEWCINGVYSKGNSISAQCNGAGGSNYVNFGFLDGEYVLGIYTELCNDYDPPVINGETGTLDQMNQIYSVGDSSFPIEDFKEKVRLIQDCDYWKILLPSGEFLTVDEAFDFEYFLWE